MSPAILQVAHVCLKSRHRSRRAPEPQPPDWLSSSTTYFPPCLQCDWSARKRPLTIVASRPRSCANKRNAKRPAVVSRSLTTSSRIPAGSSSRAGCTARHSTGSRTGAARAAKVRSAALKRPPAKYWRPSLRRSSTFRRMPRTRSSERCALSGVILYVLRTRNRARGAITGIKFDSTRGTPRDHKERSSLACGNNCEYAQRRVCGPSSVSKHSSSASISLRSAVSRGYRRPPPQAASACTRMSVESMKRLLPCTSIGTVPRPVRIAKSR